MKSETLTMLLLLAGLAPGARARQTPEPEPETVFESASTAVQGRLAESLAELARLRERIAAEKIPMSRELGELEAELGRVRLEYQQTTRLLDSRTLDLTNLRGEIEGHQDEATYLSNLLGEYVRNFESRLHVVELQRYEAALEAAQLAPENSNLSGQEVFEAQTALLGVALDRLEDALGGARFDGTAVDAGGLVEKGTFVMVGPLALFRSADGEDVGTAEQRLGSLEPAVIGFANPEDEAAAAGLVVAGAGAFPLDPTLGNAHKIAATEESFVEHVEAGGPVMIPIFAMGAAALLVALFKWIGLAFVPKPSKRKVSALLDAVGRRDTAEAESLVQGMRGPIGRMLSAGVAHLGEPRELIEEVMYETVLTARLKMQRFLPFIAICAASAPLLGLLGTVTGIISTFKLITVFGSGDVKTLSGGISEALITTEFGLIIAIPSLLIHAFLSRKARAIVGRMETAAMAFVNQVGRSELARGGGAPPAAPSPGTAGRANRGPVGKEARAVAAGDELVPTARRGHEERVGAARRIQPG